MARKRRKRRTKTQTYRKKAQRDIKHDLIHHPGVLGLDLLDVEDRRQPFDKYPKKIDGTAARVSTTDRTKQGVKYRRATAERYYFDNPLAVVTCRRRQKRRQILFKIKKIGKGKGVGKQKKRKLNDLSEIRC